jgi:molybdopterin-guanine dinucleotide biosynthesis protein B
MVQPPVVQVVGYKKSGKTSLVCELIHQYTAQGLRVGSVKHDAHKLRFDGEGTDTWKHCQAGAQLTAVTSADQTVIFKQSSSPLQDLIQAMNEMDLVIVEGFKHEPYPKVVMIKRDEDQRLLTELTHIIAVVSWIPLEDVGVPVWTWGQTSGLADYILVSVGGKENTEFFDRNELD